MKRSIQKSKSKPKEKGSVRNKKYASAFASTDAGCLLKNMRMRPSWSSRSSKMKKATCTKVNGKPTVSTGKEPWSGKMETSTKVVGKPTVCTVKEPWSGRMAKRTEVNGKPTRGTVKEPWFTTMKTSTKVIGKTT